MKFKKNLIAFLVIGILGTVSHFVYDWLGQNMIVGLFFPVSESVWEHLKLIFYPAVIYFAFDYFFGKEEKTENYCVATVFGIYFAMFLTVALFYIYTGIFGFNIDFINILIFFISVIALLKVRNKIIESEKFTGENSKIIAGVLLGLNAFLFAVWSIIPPSLGIFTPPVI